MNHALDLYRHVQSPDLSNITTEQKPWGQLERPLWALRPIRSMCVPSVPMPPASPCPQWGAQQLCGDNTVAPLWPRQRLQWFRLWGQWHAVPSTCLQQPGFLSSAGCLSGPQKPKQSTMDVLNKTAEQWWLWGQQQQETEFTVQLLMKGKWASLEGLRIRPILSVPNIVPKYYLFICSKILLRAVLMNPPLVSILEFPILPIKKLFLVCSLMGDWLWDWSISFHLTLFSISKCFAMTSGKGLTLLTPFLDGWRVHLCRS